MDRILYCPGPFSTYNARFLHSQEPDEVMFKKHKEIIEVCSKYNLKLDIKVHPSGEEDNLAHFNYLTKNYKNVKVFGSYWKWFLKAEKIIPKYQLVILDIIRTAIVPVMARSDIPCILYTKTSLLKQWNLESLGSIIYVVKTRTALDKLIKKFSFGELYQPKNEQVIKKWFKKRETIQRWYSVGRKDFILRRKFRHEWKSDNTFYIDLQKLLKRIKRIGKPPDANNNTR